MDFYHVLLLHHYPITSFILKNELSAGLNSSFIILAVEGFNSLSLQCFNTSTLHHFGASTLWHFMLLRYIRVRPPKIPNFLSLVNLPRDSGLRAFWSLFNTTPKSSGASKSRTPDVPITLLITLAKRLVPGIATCKD
jgi:hypothetical protein